VAHSMSDSSVVPIDGGVGAKEQASPSQAAGDLNKQPTQSPFETSKAVDDAVDDPTAKERDALAERYFKNDLADQRRWYSEKAGLFKTRAELLALLTIVLGALITFIQVFAAAPWVPIVSGLIGAIVAIAAGWQRIARYSETWMSYRTASERMKRERRLYTHGAGSYRGLPEREAYLTFVEATEGIIAEEQNIFWRERGNNPPTPTGNSDAKTAGEPRETSANQ
jgi:F0F1-type ATP synthase assembly protein I